MTSRVLWTCPYLPWPLTSGGKVRQYQLLNQMRRRGHAVTLLVQSKTPLDDAARAALEPLVERLIVLPRRRLSSPKTLTAAALSRLPLLATVNGHAPRLEKTFAALLAERWDVVHIEHTYGAEPYIDLLERRGQAFVLSEQNVESALDGATYGKWPRPLRPLVRYDRWRTRRWERRILSRAERVIAVTVDDAIALHAIGQRPVDVVVNGVDARAFADVRPDVTSKRILFVGNFEYAPNVDAVHWLLDEIMPRVWRRIPHARIAICGYAMPSRWLRDRPDPRISWLGYVPRLPDVQRRSAVFVAPLRHGGGSKLKVLEAMAAGMPIVGTDEAVSGLAVASGIDALVANDAAGIGDGIVALLTDPLRARRVGEAGRSFVEAYHDWSASAAALEAVYERVRGAPVRRAPRGPACASASTTAR